jgi:hypothetical protein
MPRVVNTVSVGTLRHRSGFAYASRLRPDQVLRILPGMTRFPIDGTILNMSKRFRQGMCGYMSRFACPAPRPKRFVTTPA